MQRYFMCNINLIYATNIRMIQANSAHLNYVALYDPVSGPVFFPSAPSEHPA